jgi:hypothetical protein
VSCPKRISFSSVSALGDVRPFFIEDPTSLVFTPQVMQLEEWVSKMWVKNRYRVYFYVRTGRNTDGAGQLYREDRNQRRQKYLRYRGLIDQGQ